MTQLTEMVEPARPVVSDQDTTYEEPRRRWLGCLGWALMLSFWVLPFGFLIHEAVRSTRADAKFRREMATEKREMRRLLNEMAKGNKEEKRLARELIAELEKGGSR
jgi:hypothetical protein